MQSCPQTKWPTGNEGAEKAPNVGRRPTAGDYKGAQPPYRADKRAERAMSARLIKNKLAKRGYFWYGIAKGRWIPLLVKELLLHGLINQAGIFWVGCGKSEHVCLKFQQIPSTYVPFGREGGTNQENDDCWRRTSFTKPSRHFSKSIIIGYNYFHQTLQTFLQVYKKFC